MFCISHLAFLEFNLRSIDISNLGNKNIRNVYAVSTNQIVDILQFNDVTYLVPSYFL